MCISVWRHVIGFLKCEGTIVNIACPSCTICTSMINDDHAPMYTYIGFHHNKILCNVTTMTYDM